MKLSIHSHSLIESALKDAVSRFAKACCEQTVITDIHLLPKQGSGELIILDDDDEELARITINEWADYSNDDFYEHVERALRADINKQKEAGAFDDLTILKPFSFVLVDEEHETIADLLLMDEDTMLVNDELLKGLDKEVDDFLKELLES